MMSKRQKQLVTLLLKGAEATIRNNIVALEREATQAVYVPFEEARVLLGLGVLARVGDQLKTNEHTKPWLKRMTLAQKPVEPMPQQTQAPHRYKPGFARIKLPTGRHFFDAHHILAAEKFSYMFEHAGYRQHVTVNYDSFHLPRRPKGSVSDNMSDGAVAAQQNLGQIHERLGAELYSVLIDACVFEKGLGHIEQERAWPRRGGKFMLKVALDQLASHWGLQPQAPTSHHRQHQWRADERLPLRQGY